MFFFLVVIIYLTGFIFPLKSKKYLISILRKLNINMYKSYGLKISLLRMKYFNLVYNFNKFNQKNKVNSSKLQKFSKRYVHTSSKNTLKVIKYPAKVFELAVFKIDIPQFEFNSFQSKRIFQSLLSHPVSFVQNGNKLYFQSWTSSDKHVLGNPTKILGYTPPQNKCNLNKPSRLLNFPGNRVSVNLGEKNELLLMSQNNEIIITP